MKLLVKNFHGMILKPIFDKETLDTIKNLNKEFNLSDHLINKLLIETNKSKHF